MQVEIVNIGDELLIGQVINSNAARMGAALSLAGYTVRRMVTISDLEKDIIGAIEERLPETKIILFSGGLGPTRDDLTKETLAKYFNQKLVFNQEAFDNIVSLFATKNFDITENNRSQAFLPEGAISLPNPSGTARGMWFERDDLVVISLPGVPFELDDLMKSEVIPRLKAKFISYALLSKTVMTTGLGESFLAIKISDWENELPDYMKLAYLPQPGIVRLRVSINAEEPQAETKLEAQIKKLQKIIPVEIFGYNEARLEEVVGELLRKNDSSLAVAESCTGGYISHLITTIPGSSDYFTGGVVSYSNAIKTSQLNVDSALIENEGAVSQSVVIAMAEQVKKKFKSDYAISTSGVAGPGGGTPEKPVGTVWIAIATPTKTVSKRFQVGEHRERNIRRAALIALNLLRLELLENVDGI